MKRLQMQWIVLLASMLSAATLWAFGSAPSNLPTGVTTIVTPNGVSAMDESGAAIRTIPPMSGTSFFAVKRTDISTTSVAISFGLTAKKIALVFPPTNTGEVCVNWTGGTAVCPQQNTAGDDRFAPGDSILLDDFAVTSVSVISESGVQTVYMRAWQ